MKTHDNGCRTSVPSSDSHGEQHNQTAKEQIDSAHLCHLLSSLTADGRIRSAECSLTPSRGPRLVTAVIPGARLRHGQNRRSPGAHPDDADLLKRLNAQPPESKELLAAVARELEQLACEYPELASRLLARV